MGGEELGDVGPGVRGDGGGGGGVLGGLVGGEDALGAGGWWVDVGGGWREGWEVEGCWRVVLVFAN